MPLPFNKNLDLKLIHMVKQNNILYDTKESKYLDFDAREVIWQKIGDALNRPAQVCKARWINIRDMMRRKIRERTKNPSHRSYKYKYEEELDFMLPFFRDSISSHNNEEYTDFLEDEINSCDVEMPTEVYVDGGIDYSREEHKESKPNVANLRNTKKTMDDSNTSPVSREFLNQTREYSTNDPIYQDSNTSDPVDVFLLTIGSTLRKFSPYYLNQAKTKIFQVVQDYELEQIMNKDDQAQSTSDR